jgi:hypothetical protein
MGDFIPGRFALGLWFSIAVLFASILDELWVWLTQRSGANVAPLRHGGRGSNGRRRRVTPAIATLLLAGACLLPLVPNWPYMEVPANVPIFFTSTAVDQVPPGSLALTYPYPLTAVDAPMVWQADTAMRFRMLGGYYISPNPSGAGTFFGDPNPLSLCLSNIIGAGTASLFLCDPATLRNSLNHLGVENIMIDPSTKNAWVARQVLTATIGRQPRSVGGVLLWQCLPSRSASTCHWR